MALSDLAILPKWGERRRRLSRPVTLVVFGLAFLALPVINYFGVAYSLQYPPRFYRLVLAAMNPIEMALLVLPIPVGLGLLLVRKWGWYLLLAYGLLLSGYNLVVFALTLSRYNFGALATTLFGISAVAYFVRRDISAPFMKMYPRGWRLQKRLPVRVPLAVGGRSLQSRDLSELGLYAEWPDFSGEVGDEVHVELSLADVVFKVRAGVARIDTGFGVGLAFRELTPTQEEDIRQALRVHAREQKRSLARIAKKEGDS